MKTQEEMKLLIIKRFTEAFNETMIDFLEHIVGGEENRKNKGKEYHLYFEEWKIGATVKLHNAYDKKHRYMEVGVANKDAPDVNQFIIKTNEVYEQYDINKMIEFDKDGTIHILHDVRTFRFNLKLEISSSLARRPLILFNPLTGLLDLVEYRYKKYPANQFPQLLYDENLKDFLKSNQNLTSEIKAFCAQNKPYEDAAQKYWLFRNMPASISFVFKILALKQRHPEIMTFIKDERGYDTLWSLTFEKGFHEVDAILQPGKDIYEILGIKPRFTEFFKHLNDYVLGSSFLEYSKFLDKLAAVDPTLTGSDLLFLARIVSDDNMHYTDVAQTEKQLFLPEYQVSNTLRLLQRGYTTREIVNYCVLMGRKEFTAPKNELVFLATYACAADFFENQPVTRFPEHLYIAHRKIEQAIQFTISKYISSPGNLPHLADFAKRTKSFEYNTNKFVVQSVNESILSALEPQTVISIFESCYCGFSYVFVPRKQGKYLCIELRDKDIVKFVNKPNENEILGIKDWATFYNLNIECELN